MKYSDLEKRLFNYTNGWAGNQDWEFPLNDRADRDNAVSILKKHYKNVNGANLDYNNGSVEGVDYKVLFAEAHKDDELRYMPDKNPNNAVLINNGMSEAIEKHDELNQNIWNGKELKPEVKEKLQLIADTFIEKLKEDDIPIEVKDIILVGSNVNYNYTKDSDLDLHIQADLSQFKGREKELAEKIYQCKKAMFNSKYDISLYGVPVEIYVEPYQDVDANGIPDAVEEE